jgi:hypothetical protein
VPAGRRKLSPELILAILFALILVLVGILWLTGVLDRGSDRPDGPMPVVSVPPAPAPMPVPSTGDSFAAAPQELQDPPCTNVFNERDMAGRARREDEVRNTIAVTASGTYLWNGAELNAVTLRQYLDIVSTMSPVPVTVVRVDPGAPPASVETVRDTIGRALNCQFQPA